VTDPAADDCRDRDRQPRNRVTGLPTFSGRDPLPRSAGTAQSRDGTGGGTSAASITQPGTYTASVVLTGDTPYPTPSVDVTMVVQPPKTWGKIAGTVTGYQPQVRTVKITKGTTTTLDFTLTLAS
jgi:hypothetical protein